ncbi:hypothetical protein ILYODFUR_034354 [Ilyodon furcidens]|uniref:Uncharacterized protein n=1 Tax=Ilyodon furcidens TaxID=33524 RepID=A0ABV0U078_9TELE
MRCKHMNDAKDKKTMQQKNTAKEKCCKYENNNKWQNQQQVKRPPNSLHKTDVHQATKGSRQPTLSKDINGIAQNLEGGKRSYICNFNLQKSEEEIKKNFKFCTFAM